MDSPHKGTLVKRFYVSFDVSQNKLLKEHSGSRWIDVAWRTFVVIVMRNVILTNDSQGAWNVHLHKIGGQS